MKSFLCFLCSFLCFLCSVPDLGKALGRWPSFRKERKTHEAAAALPLARDRRDRRRPGYRLQPGPPPDHSLRFSSGHADGDDTSAGVDPGNDDAGAGPATGGRSPRDAAPGPSRQTGEECSVKLPGRAT